MIRAAYRITAKLPAPRAPVVVTSAEKGYGVDLKWKPWLDAQVFGVELCWTTKYNLTIRNIDGEADATYEFGFGKQPPEADRPEITSKDGFYSIAIEHELLFPSGIIGMVLPHPRFHDVIPEGAYNDVPAVIPSLLHLDRDPKLSVILARLPQPSTEHIFYAGEPFCQIIPVPRGDLVFRPMDEAEQARHA